MEFAVGVVSLLVLIASGVTLLVCLVLVALGREGARRPTLVALGVGCASIVVLVFDGVAMMGHVEAETREQTRQIPAREQTRLAQETDAADEAAATARGLTIGAYRRASQNLEPANAACVAEAQRNGGRGLAGGSVSGIGAKPTWSVRDDVLHIEGNDWNFVYELTSQRIDYSCDFDMTTKAATLLYAR